VHLLSIMLQKIKYTLQTPGSIPGWVMEFSRHAFFHLQVGGELRYSAVTCGRQNTRGGWSVPGHSPRENNNEAYRLFGTKQWSNHVGWRCQFLFFIASKGWFNPRSSAAESRMEKTRGDGSHLLSVYRTGRQNNYKQATGSIPGRVVSPGKQPFSSRCLQIIL
jgi:hypothetical protein